jgi:YYY domain-containing protein
MLVTNYSLFILTIFSVGYNLTKKYIWGVLTALIVSVMSNISYLISIHGEGVNYWWGGSRIIPGTINEFPLCSFLLGDLHAHYLDLPFVVLILISFYLFFVKNDNRNLLKLFIGFILGLMFITNSWDFIIYGFIFAALTFYKNYLKDKNITQVIYDGLVVGVSSILVFLPFYLTFHPASEGFRIVTAEKSLITDFLILFLSQIFVISFYLLYRFIKEKNDYKMFAMIISTTLFLLSFWNSQVTALIFILLPIWFIVCWNDLKRDKIISTKQFINILILITFCIIVFCEYFYLKDIYEIEYQRANTIFKFYYQLWVIFAVIVGYVLYYFSTIKDWIRYPFFVVSGVLLIASSVYLPTMVKDSTNDFSNRVGLDGSHYLETIHLYDYQAIKWINGNIVGQKVIAEMPGESYTYNSRISVLLAIWLQLVGSDMSGAGGITLIS